VTPSLQKQIRDSLGEHEAELIELHRALVRIPTVNRGDGGSADETRLAQYAAEYLEHARVPARVEEGAPGRGNLLAETCPKGVGPRTMLWMSHSDVVPVGDETAWSYPPLSAALAEGRIWGRGSNDCKMLVACQLFVLAHLARLGLPRHGQLRLAVGADEEVGGRWGFGWLLESRREFLRADLAICEGGGSCLGRFEDGIPTVSVGSGEKGRYDVIFRVRGEGGHASTPWGKKNPLLILSEVIARLSAWQPRPQPASPLFAHLGKWVGLNEAIRDGNVEEAIGRVAARAPLLLNSLKGQSRMTITPTVLHAGDKANAIPTEAELACDARLLPGQTQSDLEEAIARILQGPEGIEGIEVTVRETSEPSVSPVDPELERMFERAATQAVGSPVKVAPVWCVGATDAHFVRAAGTPVYGFQLIHPDADAKRLGIHCINESIEASMLLPCARALAHLALEFLEGERD
jgi:acetylornithine deacetylase/succinyl-diaminopimelate desuccinylase-like protein